MKLAILMILFASPIAHAVTCAEVEYPVGLSTTVTMAGGPENPRKVAIRAPVLLSGSTLTSMRVWVSETKDSGVFDLILPLSFEVKDEQAHAEFYAQENWRYVEVVAYYGEEVCDPKLDASLWE